MIITGDTITSSQGGSANGFTKRLTSIFLREPEQSKQKGNGRKILHPTGNSTTYYYYIL